MPSAPDRRLVCVLAIVCSTAGAQSPTSASAHVSLVVQSTRLAGFAYYEGATLWEALHEGDALALRREPDNPHDANAVRVEWRGHMLGYLPRRDNAALAWALDQGQVLRARITRIRAHPNPARRVELEVYVE
jgi:HIRAN domain